MVMATLMLVMLVLVAAQAETTGVNSHVVETISRHHSCQFALQVLGKACAKGWREAVESAG